jgi:hypothetical protein
MSFRLFIYYCALCGGWSALVGWFVGIQTAPANDLGKAGIKGLFLGMMVALGLSLVDAVWNLGLQQTGKVIGRVSVALVVGAVGGLIGGMIGLLLFQASNELQLFFVLGWTLTGLLVGASIGVFEILSSLVRQRDVSGARKKLMKCLLGGTAGGILGGTLALFLRIGWVKALKKDENILWSPTAMGFVALGMCIGLLVGLAQVILKEAWIKVEAGFRSGREMILAKERTTIGRAESCDLGLFGDNTIEKLHANILQAGNRYYVEDASTPVGTFVNDQPVKGRMVLSSGDLIRVGKSLLRFNERQKRR